MGPGRHCLPFEYTYNSEVTPDFDLTTSILHYGLFLGRTTVDFIYFSPAFFICGVYVLSYVLICICDKDAGYCRF